MDLSEKTRIVFNITFFFWMGIFSTIRNQLEEQRSSYLVKENTGNSTLLVWMESKRKIGIVPSKTFTYSPLNTCNEKTVNLLRHYSQRENMGILWETEKEIHSRHFLYTEDQCTIWRKLSGVGWVFSKKCLVSVYYVGSCMFSFPFIIHVIDRQ